LSPLIKNIIRFAVILAVQIFLINNVALARVSHFGGITFFAPFFFLLFIISLPAGLNKSLTLIICFITGYIMDMFSNTGGLYASASLIVGLLRPVLIGRFFQNTTKDLNRTTPSIYKLGLRDFLTYTLIICLVFCAYWHILEVWSLRKLPHTFLKILVSTITTMLVIFIGQIFFVEKKKRR
jgi:rod shape-determining protein MreD